MLFIVLLTYQQSLDAVDAHLDAHRDFLARHYRAGHFLLSGPQQPRRGGVILARAPERTTLETWLAEDPFHVHGIATCSVIAWQPNLRGDDAFGGIAPDAATTSVTADDPNAVPAWPVALEAASVPPRTSTSACPAPFADRLGGRMKQALGDRFGLRNFGVNRVTLQPGARSALRHSHSHQDEFVQVIEGELVLVTNAGETRLAAGMCAGFRAGSGDAHHLLNRGNAPAVYLEIGDRTPGDRVQYPDDDLVAEDAGGRWRFLHKDGTAY